MPAKKKSASKRKIAKTAPATKKITSVKGPFTKGQVLNYLAERTELKRGAVVQVMDALGELVEAHMTSKGAEMFTLPGLLKIKVVHKPKTPQRKGINPFTGEPAVFKAKPARNVIKIRPLKKLKDMV